jgi:hypothetical protein
MINTYHIIALQNLKDILHCKVLSIKLNYYCFWRKKKEKKMHKVKLLRPRIPLPWQILLFQVHWECRPRSPSSSLFPPFSFIGIHIPQTGLGCAYNLNSFAHCLTFLFRKHKQTKIESKSQTAVIFHQVKLVSLLWNLTSCLFLQSRSTGIGSNFYYM